MTFFFLKIRRAGLPLLMLAVSIASCAAPPSKAPAPVRPSIEIRTPQPEPLASTPTAPATRVATTSAIELTPTPTLPAVTITAVNGNLSIRSGPDPVFDAISVLKNGETLPVLARSVLDGWVEVPLPDQSGQTGWVSTHTAFSVVDGYVLDLPEIMTVEWPSGSYLRNCTRHPMLVEPGDRRLSPVSDSKQNQAWFPPGVYTVYDLGLDGQPYVMTIQLLSHTKVDIRKDGDRKSWSCP